MTIYIDPKWIVAEFLRTFLVDPRARAETSETDSFTASASQTDFTLTPTAGTVSCITAVTVDAVTQSKWQEYKVDIETPGSEKVIFNTPLTGGEAVEITYKRGTTNWIYAGKPNEKLSATSWPRMSIITASASGQRLGNSDAPVEGTVRFQIDIWTKEKQDNQIFTINSVAYTGEELARYLAFKVTEAFEDNESELFPALYGYEPVGMPKEMPFNIEYQAHRFVVEVILKGTDLGRRE